MIRFEHSVEIDRPVSDVYSLAEQVERYPEFLPGYLESRIIARRDDGILLERKAFVKGRMTQWRSWASFRPEQTIRFEHAEGPLKGMEVEWLFTARSAARTSLKITHLFPAFRPFSRAWWRGWFVYGPGVRRMASQVVESFKLACEATGGARPWP